MIIGAVMSAETMQFSRKKLRGQDQRTAKTWKDESGCYRITWISQYMGVQVTPHYQACVRTVAPDGFIYWDFAGRQGPYRKLQAAIDACEKHRKAWNHALKLANSERKGRAERLRAFHAKARVGTGFTCNVLLNHVPEWVAKDADPIALYNLRGVLFAKGKKAEEDDEEECQESPVLQPAPMPTLKTSGSRKRSGDRTSSEKTPKRGHASSATVEDGTTKAKTRRAQSHATSVEEVVKEPARRASKGTKARWQTGGKSAKTTKQRTKRTKAA